MNINRQSEIIRMLNDVWFEVIKSDEWSIDAIVDRPLLLNSLISVLAEVDGLELDKVFKIYVGTKPVTEVKKFTIIEELEKVHEKMETTEGKLKAMYCLQYIAASMSYIGLYEFDHIKSHIREIIRNLENTEWKNQTRGSQNKRYFT